MVVGSVLTSLKSKSGYGSKYLFFCDRYAFGHQCVSGQVTSCVAAVMAFPTLRSFPVTVLTVLVALASSSEDHEWHFNPGRMSKYRHATKRTSQLVIHFFNCCLSPPKLPHLLQLGWFLILTNSDVFKPLVFFLPSPPPVHGHSNRLVLLLRHSPHILRSVRLILRPLSTGYPVSSPCLPASHV